MPKAPKPPPPIDVAKTTEQDQAARLQGGQQSQALSTIGQDNPYGTLDYTTEIDPITGLPKYKANMQFTPEQQQIFDFLQQNQTSLGSGAGGAIDANMGQWTNPFDLAGNANSLTQKIMDPAIANQERWMAPERSNKDAQLETSGILRGSKVYDREMAKLSDSQNMTKAAMQAQFMPIAEKTAMDQYQAPMDMISKMLGMSQPGNINQNLVNTPGANIGATDVAGLTVEQQKQAMEVYKQKVASQNAMMDAIIKGGIGVASLPMGGGTAGMSLGGSLLGGIMGGNRSGATGTS